MVASLQLILVFTKCPFPLQVRRLSSPKHPCRMRQRRKRMRCRVNCASYRILKKIFTPQPFRKYCVTFATQASGLQTILLGSDHSAFVITETASPARLRIDTCLPLASS